MTAEIIIIAILAVVVVEHVIALAVYRASVQRRETIARIQREADSRHHFFCPARKGGACQCGPDD